MVVTFAAGRPGYPVRLLELSDAPLVLHASGPLPSASRWVAIVGSRRASEGGRALAAEMARAVVKHGVGVVSGGAIGIDAAAHEGAIAGGGPTIVVLPTPVDRPGPKQNWSLFGEVVAHGGALISELDAEPRGTSSFSARNRIIAALADVVVVIEAGERSGTRHTVRAAERLSRPVAAVPWPDERGTVAREVEAEPIANTRELLDWLDLLGLGLTRTEDAPEADPVIALLGEQVATIDRLAERLGLPIPRLLAHLTRLELGGRVEILSGARVRRALR